MARPHNYFTAIVSLIKGLIHKPISSIQITFAPHIPATDEGDAFKSFNCCTGILPTAILINGFIYIKLMQEHFLKWHHLF